MRSGLATAPDVSVIIPGFGRAAALADCLKALAQQTISSERFEVIVCDDGSAAPLATALQPTLETLRGLRVSLVRQPNSGPAAARNRAADAARGKYLAFTDDDCRPAPDWLEKLLQRFAANPNVLIGGGMCATSTSDAYARATQAIMSFVYSDQAQHSGMLLFSTSNLAMPARAFRDLGGFSTSFRRAAGEDYDLCARWYHEGREMTYLADALVVHDHALTFAGYLRQHFRYGRGLFVMRQRLKKRGGAVRPGRTPGGFHLRLIASPISARPPFGVGSALLIALSQLATASGVLAELVFSRKGSRNTGALAKAPYA
jgi:glycosyltransferase involved in cell wall biosynthesis